VLHDRIGDSGRILNQLVYQKGGWTLHMLRKQLGAEKFREGIRAYYNEYRDRNASTDDLRGVMERVSDQKLDWFFTQWLKRPGSPVVEGTWTYEPKNKRLVIELKQKQEGMPYRLPMEIGIRIVPGQPMKLVEKVLDTAEQRLEIPLEREPAEVALDPNTWVLMQASTSKK
jgi:aminopeptidase N